MCIVIDEPDLIDIRMMRGHDERNAWMTKKEDAAGSRLSMEKIKSLSADDASQKKNHGP